MTPDRIRAEAEARFPAIIERSFRGLLEVAENGHEPGSDVFRLNDLRVRGSQLRVRLAVVPLPAGREARTYVNTTSENHVIQLSDLLPPEDAGTVLRLELDTLVTQRRRAQLAALTPILDRATTSERNQSLQGAASLGERAKLPERFHYPRPGQSPDGRLITRDELPSAVRRAAGERQERSAETLEWLRRETGKLPAGVYPKLPVMIGAGASVAGRDPNRLVIDTRGRWQIDPTRGLVQSADQVSQIRETGMGDPYQFADPRQRLPIGALRLWEDTLAVQGPLVNGYGRLLIDDQKRLLAQITPTDGSAPVTVEVEGDPLIATGIAPQVLPGCSRRVPSVPQALHTLTDRISAGPWGSTSDVVPALAGLTDEEGSARRALDILRDSDLLPELRKSEVADIQGALQTLEATATWDHYRRVAPGRVLLGDEVSDGRFDPNIAETWIVAGRGGGGNTNPEIILENNSEALVTQLGGAPPTVLRNNAQFMELMRRYDANMGGDGRLKVISGVRLGTIEAAEGKGGELRFHAHGVEANAYVSCLGRTPRLPRVLDAVCGPTRVPPEAITGRLVFDDSRQYLGYHLSVDIDGTRHGFEVTGSASRILPPRIFSAEDMERINRIGLQEAPPESGNVAAGFMSTAEQAVRLELHRARHGGNLPVTGSSAAQPKAAPARKPSLQGETARTAGGGRRSAANPAPPSPLRGGGATRRTR